MADPSGRERLLDDVVGRLGHEGIQSAPVDRDPVPVAISGPEAIDYSRGSDANRKLLMAPSARGPRVKQLQSRDQGSRGKRPNQPPCVTLNLIINEPILSDGRLSCRKKPLPSPGPRVRRLRGSSPGRIVGVSQASGEWQLMAQQVPVDQDAIAPESYHDGR